MRERQRRLDGVDQLVLSLTGRGLTTGEIAAHFEEVYGARVSKDTSDVLGAMLDPFCRELELTVAPANGCPLFLTTSPAVLAEGLLLGLATP